MQQANASQTQRDSGGIYAQDKGMDTGDKREHVCTCPRGPSLPLCSKSFSQSMPPPMQNLSSPVLEVPKRGVPPRVPSHPGS